MALLYINVPILSLRTPWQLACARSQELAHTDAALLFATLAGCRGIFLPEFLERVVPSVGDIARHYSQVINSEAT